MVWIELITDCIQQRTERCRFWVWCQVDTHCLWSIKFNSPSATERTFGSRNRSVTLSIMWERRWFQKYIYWRRLWVDMGVVISTMDFWSSAKSGCCVTAPREHLVQLLPLIPVSTPYSYILYRVSRTLMRSYESVVAMTAPSPLHQWSADFSFGSPLIWIRTYVPNL
jgi:hypothetical protein